MYSVRLGVSAAPIPAAMVSELIDVVFRFGRTVAGKVMRVPYHFVHCID